MVGAGLSWGLGHTHGNLAPWQLVFLVSSSFDLQQFITDSVQVVGVISFSMGILALFALPSSPNTCVFLTPMERNVAVWRVSHDRTGVKNTQFLWYQALEAAKDIQMYCFAALAPGMGILNGAAGNFFSVIIAGFGYGSLKVLLYQLPIGAFQFTATVAGRILTSYVPNTLCVTIIAGFIVGIAGMIGIATISTKHPLALLACTWLQGVWGVSNILSWTLVAVNVAGHTKRTTANAVWFLFYAAGNIIGPLLFLPAEAPRYFTAIKALAGMFGSCIFFTVCLGGIMFADRVCLGRKRSKFLPRLWL